MNIIKTIFNAVLWSSENPSKVSASLKWGLPFLIFVASYFGLDLSELTDGLVDETMTNFATAVTGVMTLWYSGRKVKNAIKRKNANQ